MYFCCDSVVWCYSSGGVVWCISGGGMWCTSGGVVRCSSDCAL